MSTPPQPQPSPPGRDGVVLRMLNCGCGCIMLLFAVGVLLWLLGSYAIGYFTE